VPVSFESSTSMRQLISISRVFGGLSKASSLLSSAIETSGSESVPVAADVLYADLIGSDGSKPKLADTS